MVLMSVSGGTRSAAAAAAAGQARVVCPQERATRQRGAGVNASGLPDEAMGLVLERLGAAPAEVTRLVVAEGIPPVAVASPHDTIDHVVAHACTAYLTSPFAAAAIVVCDDDCDGLRVFTGAGGTVTPQSLTFEGPSLTTVLSMGATALGITGAMADRRFEALARLNPDARDAGIDAMLRLEDGRCVVSPDLAGRLAAGVAGDHDPGSTRRSQLAAALQARVGDVLVEMLAAIRPRLGATRLCLGGSLFYHSYLNSRAKLAGVFDEVFVPVDPGNAGLAVGALQAASGEAPSQLSPFLGPAYSGEDVKRVLDNCKLQYAWRSEGDVLGEAVDALRQGRLVALFDGPMEYGPRALGARSILASPASPYVLENLNRFLKQREPWRGYALSGLAADVADHFDGPAAAPFMECDYRPRDVSRFRHILPAPGAAIRVHTVTPEATGRLGRLLQAFRDATGEPFLVNTSFNGFHEPIVCRPRDAVRVFFGTGLDLMLLEQFVLAK